jgi:hypothetical protein
MKVRMKTKLILYVSVITAALFGMGCNSLIYSEDEYLMALNENAGFESDLKGWVVKEGSAEIIGETEGPFGGEKILRLKISERGFARIESAQKFQFSPGNRIGIGATIRPFKIAYARHNSLRSEYGSTVRIGPTPKVERYYYKGEARYDNHGGIGYGDPLLYNGWFRLFGGWKVPQPKSTFGIGSIGSTATSRNSNTIEGSLWFEFRPDNPLSTTYIEIDNLAILRKPN